MKKFFTLIAAVMMAVCTNAATKLEGSFNAWGSTCTVDGGTLTYTSAWAGAGFWLATGDSNAGTYAGYNMSECDYLWITVAEGSTAGIKLCVQYGASCAAGASGTSETTAAAGALIIGAQLDPAQKSDVSQFFLQSTSTGSLTVTGAYIGTAEEFQAAAASNKQQKSELSLSDLSAGWSSSYDAATKTITYESDWGGRGWWLGTADYSDYDYIVVELAQPLEGYCQINVEYNANTKKEDGTESMNTSTGIQAGDTKAVIPLNAEGKNSVKQIYVQSGEGVRSITLAAAYVCTEKYLLDGIVPVTADNSTAKKAAKKAIKNGSIIISANGNEYNVAGQLIK